MSVAALVVLAVAIGSGGVAAQGGENGPCPGENPNVGYDRSSDTGKERSLRGIVVANTSLDCPPLPASLAVTG